MVKKILKKVNFLILIGCVVMFILSSNSLINIAAAVSEPTTPNGSYVPYQSITTDLSDAKKSEYIANESKYTRSRVFIR